MEDIAQSYASDLSEAIRGFGESMAAAVAAFKSAADAAAAEFQAALAEATVKFDSASSVKLEQFRGGPQLYKVDRRPMAGAASIVSTSDETEIDP